MSRPRLLETHGCQGGAHAGYTEHIGRQLLAHIESERAA